MKRDIVNITRTDLSIIRITREELLKTCEDYFTNNMIEGIVVRSLDGKWSSKIINLHYDSKK